MKPKRFWLIRPLNIMLIAVSLVMCGVLFFADKKLFFIFTPIVLTLDIVGAVRIFKIQQDLHRAIASMGKAASDRHEGELVRFPIPTLITTEEGEIVWYNDKFRSVVLKDGKDLFGYPLSWLIKEELSELLSCSPRIVSCGEDYYEVYALKTDDEKPLCLLYFVDVTKLERSRLEQKRRRPVVMQMLIDNYDETIGKEADAGRLRLLNDVRNAILNFSDSTSGFLRRVDHDRYLMVVEKQDLDKMFRNRFEILDKIRAIETENRTPVTLSIGVAAVTDTLRHAENEARKALEMALGRGGDQVAVKTETGYEFFGGFSKGVEKQTKVKTRIVASALAELIKGSDKVLVMGHRFADLDSLGSAIGLCRACRCLGKESYIVLDSRRNLADVLVRRLVEEKQQDMISLPESALEQVTDKTLLIITDTHTVDLIESPEIYKRCKQVVVIDHHRKMVNHIEGAVIFYHEPFASSASEMVTELVQYLGDACRLNRMEAEALLSGIMLDTKNFVMKTGVRTFEAAAYLRRIGADTIAVRELFSSTIGSYRLRAQIVSGAELLHSCAIAVCDIANDDMRVVAPQAADELLSISGVKASFVIYAAGGAVNVSARSMGAYNVQVIMEKMGGGGHHTMAGAQVKDSDCHQVRTRLAAIIEEYAEEQERKEG